MMGSYLGTDRTNIVLQLENVIFQKKDVEFTDKMFEDLKLTEKENYTLKRRMHYIWKYLIN